MKKIIFDVSDALVTRMDGVIVKDGFNSRSEFLRFLIQNYLQRPKAALEPEAEAKRHEKIDYLGIPKESIARIQAELELRTK